MEKIKVLTVFGTRPEVIKLAPLIKTLEHDSAFISLTCATTQQKELQNDILEFFNIKADYELDIMRQGQDLFYITEAILNKIKPILTKECPHYVIVHGDTSTAFSAAISAFYCQIPVIHIEAGLRTGNIYSPYPEEANRLLISKIASLHMAPTQLAVNNLAAEGVTQNVFNFGNTIVDAVQLILKNPIHSPTIKDFINTSQKKILITVHRRENFGRPLQEICAAIKELACAHPDCMFVWPVHPNPNIYDYAHKNMCNLPNIKLCQPFSYAELLFLLDSAFLILSDSGGIQEEACILNKNILILREETERPEVVQAGYGVLVGSSKNKIITAANNFINNPEPQNAHIKNIYGAPGVCLRIIAQIKTDYTVGTSKSSSSTGRLL